MVTPGVEDVDIYPKNLDRSELLDIAHLFTLLTRRISNQLDIQYG